MDIDAIKQGAWLTEAEIKDLQKNNACFYCQKSGHISKNCFKQKRDRSLLADKQPRLPPPQIKETTDQENINWTKETLRNMMEQAKANLTPEEFVDAMTQSNLDF